MKRALIVLAAAGLLGLAVPGGATASGNSFASGAGSIAGGKSFNFTAHDNAAGVIGQMHISNGANEGVADVTCLSVAGNAATLVGTVTRGDAPSFPPGSVLIFNVQDNSQFGIADTFTTTSQPFPPGNCTASPGSQPLLTGNIVVKTTPFGL
ncbi:MAG: hypothetical protein NVSMB25_12670 [Thermoleophilaceae bacterium]